MFDALFLYEGHHSNMMLDQRIMVCKMIEMAEDTDYSEFENSIDYTMKCAAGDSQATPAFMYVETVASYTHGGGAGGQSSKGPITTSFDAALAAGANYVVTVKGNMPELVVVATATPGNALEFFGDQDVVTGPAAPFGSPAPTSQSPATAAATTTAPATTGPAPLPLEKTADNEFMLTASSSNFLGLVITSALLFGMTFIMF
jgi:hypothetical protein